MLLCMIPVAIALLTVTGSLVQKRILQFVILILLAGLFFSYSRGAWLALLTGWLAYAAISKKFIMRLLLLFAVSGTLLICWLGYNNRYLDYAPNYRKTIYHADFAAHMKATYQFRDLSTAERFYRWVAGMRMITEHPLTGFGPNNFVDYYHRYTVTSYQTYVSRNTERSTAHNYFLLTTIEQGIPGLLILLIIIGSMFSMTQRIYANSKDKFIRTTAITSGVILMMIVTLNMLSDLVETDKIGSIFFLLMGVLIKLDDNRLPAG
jgi:O-antigen ligase